MSFQAMAKVMLFNPENRFFGPGPAQLLMRIRETGSVKEAAKVMGVSYSKAWKMIDGVEGSLGFDVVERSSGGSHGGKARLTERGERLLADYEGLREEVAAYTAEAFERHLSWLNGEKHE